jgi:hypothetical protein
VEDRYKFLRISYDQPGCKNWAKRRVANFFKPDRLVAYKSIIKEGWKLKGTLEWSCPECVSLKHLRR